MARLLIVNDRDCLTEQHPWRRQDDDRCAGAAADPESRVFDLEMVGEALMDFTPGAARDRQLPALAAVAAAGVETARRVLEYLLASW